MALLTATMSVSIQCLGPEPPDNWGAYNWNAFVWGAGTAPVPKRVVKQLPGQSVTASAAKNFLMTKLLPGQSVSPTDAWGRNLTKGLPVQSISASSAVAHEYLQDPNGYFHVFPEQVTDFVLTTTPNWSSSTSTPVTWTSQVAGSTTWS